MLAGAVSTAQPVGAQTRVSSAVLSKGYVDSKPVGVTNTFKPSDRVIHCTVKLNQLRSNKIRYEWIAVDAAAMKNYKILEKSLSGLFNSSHFQASLPNNWPSGKYRADIYLNGKLAKSVPATIR